MEWDIEFVFETNLSVEAETDVVVISSRVETDVGTETGKPAKTATDVEVPLVDTGEVDVGTPIFEVVPSEVEFEAVGGAKAMEVGEFGGGAVTEGTADTDCVLGVAGKAEGNDSH